MSSDLNDQKARDNIATYISSIADDTTEVSATYIDKIICDIAPGVVGAYDTQTQRFLSSYDTVYMRGPKLRFYSPYLYYLSNVCRFANIHTLTDYSLYYPGTKVAQQFIFNEMQAPFLRTLYCTDKQLLINYAEKSFGYPYVLKTNDGSHGDSNHLVGDIDEARSILIAEPKVDFLAQEFCPNDHDYRVLIVGNRELVFERRGADDSHLNNTSKGADAIKAVDGDIPKEIMQLSHDVTKRLRLTISGVDVMPNRETGEFVFLEVNSQPQLVTGAFTDEKAQLMQKLIYSS